MSKRDSNIDPFNAGEPVLPWDDPSAAHDDEQACAFEDDAPYRAPSKRRDDYEVSDRRPKGYWAANDPIEPAEAPAEVGGEPVEAEGPEGSEPSGAKRSSARPSRRDGSSARPEPYEQPASSVGGKKGWRASSGRRGHKGAVGLLVAVVLVVYLLGNTLLAIVSCAVDVFDGVDSAGESLLSFFEDDYDDYDHDYYYDDDESGYVVTTPLDDEDEEREAAATAAEELLGNFASNEVARSYVSESFDELCESYIGYSADELGIDVEDVADRVLAGFGYASFSCYVYPGYDGGNPTGTFYFDFSGYYLSDAGTAFCEDARDYLRGQGVDLSAEEGERDSLTSAQKAYVQSLLDEALGSLSPDRSLFGSLELERVDGVWQVSADSLEAELSYLLDGF